MVLVFFQNAGEPARLFLVFRDFRAKLACGRGPVLFDNFESCNVANDSVSEPFSSCVDERFQGLLVGLVVFSEPVRIESDKLPRDLLDRCYPNLSHTIVLPERACGFRGHLRYWFQIVVRVEEFLNNLFLDAKNVPVVAGK